MMYLFVYLGFYVAFNTVQVISRRVVGRAEETSTYSSLGLLYCKLPTNGKQLPAFPLTAMTGIEPRPQRWEARVLPLCHRGPFEHDVKQKNKSNLIQGGLIMLFKTKLQFKIVFLQIS